MKIVRLSAGLGNQLFMYAFARRLSVIHDDKVKLDTSWWDQDWRFNSDERKISLLKYDISLEQATEDEVRSIFPAGVITNWLRDTRDLGLSPRPEVLKLNLNCIPDTFPVFSFQYLNYYYESRNPETQKDESQISRDKWARRRQFDDSVLKVTGDAYFDGFWETYKYFETIEDIIKADLTYSGEFGNRDSELIEMITEMNAISVHVRHGNVAEKGNNVPLDYQQLAAEYVAERVSNPHFFIFSDSPEFCKRNLSLDYPTTYVTHNDSSTDYLDLELMRRCDHQIIANSTFSWWGAWLNDNNEKIVVAPSPWAVHTGPGDSIFNWDLLPPEWNILNYEREAIVEPI